MDPENLLALEVVKVICLLVIAMSLYRATSSYFDGDMSKASLPHLGERSDPSFFMGSSEPPVFYGVSDFEKINEALQAAKSSKEGFAGAAVKNVKDFSDLENLAGAGL